MLERFKVPENDRIYVKADHIREITEKIFIKQGLEVKDAESSTDVLITNDLRGIESHGISNGLRRYISEYSEKNINPRPKFKIIRETKTTMTIDADRALGIHVGPIAMNYAIEKGKEFGMGAVSVFNTGHLAGCGYYAMMAAQRDMIGHCMTAGAAYQTLPPFGKTPVAGTNPIAWAAPSKYEHPFIFDIATSQVANNKIGLARRIGSKILPWWIADLEGNPIKEEILPPNPGEYNLLHIGGSRENGSHKGFGLALMNEIICNELSGFGPGPIYRHHGGHFFQAYNIEAFTDLEKFKTDMDDLLKFITNITPTEGNERVIYPGLTEGEDYNKRSEEGIPYHYEVVDWINSYCNEVGIKDKL